MADDETTERVREVLADADEPLRVGQIQRRIARRSRDVATSAIRDACGELVEAGDVEAVEGTPTEYRVAED
ncbi:hypothetical protein [Halomicrobium salinisoli]|uniref:hypothetical protein n=1 Tax=Halomicrobium salinisoli TaxID=2878391 RepID=UPI001CEFFC4A|nr:hypothetical protein [Halomicrobium salinisoli]